MSKHKTNYFSQACRNNVRQTFRKIARTPLNDLDLVFYAYINKSDFFSPTIFVSSVSNLYNKDELNFSSIQSRRYAFLSSSVGIIIPLGQFSMKMNTPLLSHRRPSRLLNDAKPIDCRCFVINFYRHFKNIVSSFVRHHGRNTRAENNELWIDTATAVEHGNLNLKFLYRTTENRENNTTVGGHDHCNLYHNLCVRHFSIMRILL